LTDAERNNALAQGIDALHRFHDDAMRVLAFLLHVPTPGDPFKPAKDLPPIYVPKLVASAATAFRCLRGAGYEFDRRPLDEFTEAVRTWDVDRAPGAWEAVKRLLHDIEAKAKAALGQADPLARTVEILGQSRSKIRLVKYLAGRAGREAELATIVTDYYKRRTVNTINLDTARRLAERTRSLLDVERAPLRLRIAASVVRLVDADPVA
jgi:hypothetical protein